MPYECSSTLDILLKCAYVLFSVDVKSGLLMIPMNIKDKGKRGRSAEENVGT
jgi:hypothetical protein